MSALRYKKSIISRRMFWHLLRDFFVILGVINLFLGILVVLWPNNFNFGWQGLTAILVISFVISTIRSWPKNKMSICFSHPDIKITVKTGNILQEKGHLVIGFSDVFDTEIGKIISADSLQGQFLSSIYQNNTARLDEDINKSLEGLGFVVDSNKNTGKNKRYATGTTAVLTGEQRKYFCCAYSKMGNDLKATSDVNILWDSLNRLWEKIRLEGEQKEVCIPVIGINLARVKGVSYSLLLKLILLSFLVNSRIEPITKKIKIIIRDEDIEKVNLLEISDFLNTLNKE